MTRPQKIKNTARNFRATYPKAQAELIVIMTAEKMATTREEIVAALKPKA